MTKSLVNIKMKTENLKISYFIILTKNAIVYKWYENNTAAHYAVYNVL